VDQVPDRDSWKLTATTITGKGGVPPVLRCADVAFWPERDVRAAILMAALGAHAGKIMRFCCRIFTCILPFGD